MRSGESLLVLALSLFAATAGVVAMFVTGAPVSLGAYIPHSDLMTDYAYGVIFSIACYAVIMVFPVALSDRFALMVIWSIKILVAMVFMLFYESFYWFLDAYGYFVEPMRPSFSWDGFVIGRGTENIYNLVSLCYRVLPESFHTLKILFSFVGLWAVYLSYRAAIIVLGKKDLRLLYALALFPSILFWSSTLGKDPIVLLGIGLYAYGAAAWYANGSLRMLALLGLGVLVAVFVRPWLGPILLAPLLINYLFAKHGLLKKAIAIALTVVALGSTLSLVAEQFAIGASQDVLESLDATSRSWASGGSAQELTVDLTRPTQLLAALPVAMFSALFRPLPGEIENVFGFLAGIENVILILLLGRAIRRFHFADLRHPAITGAVLLILAWTLAYAFISYQNLGTAVRFRLQIFPVMLAVLLYFGRRRTPRRIQGEFNSSAIAKSGA